MILTSNNTRDLSAALKRRCLHLFLDYPTAERELEIVRSKNTGLADALAKQLVDIVRGLRELELRKSPSISEAIDWARTLAVLGVEELKASVLSDTASVVVKYDRDVRTAIGALPRLVDPNATVPGAGHGHGHGHNGDHSAADTHDADGRDGPRVRAAKDRVGRHGVGADGNPLRLGRPAAGTEPGRRCAPSPRARAASRSSRAASVRCDHRAILHPRTQK